MKKKRLEATRKRLEVAEMEGCTFMPTLHSTQPVAQPTEPVVVLSPTCSHTRNMPDIISLVTLSLLSEPALFMESTE